MEPKTTGHVIPWMESLESIKEAADDWGNNTITIFANDGSFYHHCFDGKTYIRSGGPLDVGAVYSREYFMTKLNMLHVANFQVLRKAAFRDVFWEIARIPGHDKLLPVLKKRYWYEAHFD